MSDPVGVVLASRPSLGARLAAIASSLPTLTKLMLGALVALHVSSVAVPVTAEYVSLVPGNSIPYLWNVFTASWLETRVVALAVSCVLLMLVGEEGTRRREGRGALRRGRRRSVWLCVWSLWDGTIGTDRPSLCLSFTHARRAPSVAMWRPSSQGRVVEPAMGTREFVKFVLFTNGFIGACAFVTMLFVYYGTRDEKMLYKKFNGMVRACPHRVSHHRARDFPPSRAAIVDDPTDPGVISSFRACVGEALPRGFQGIAAGMLVAVRQTLPEGDVAVASLRIKCRHLPAVHLGVMLAVAASLHEYLALFGFTLFGGLGGWVYLRFYQPRSDGTGVGDPSEHMSCVSFFPGFAAPLLSPLADVVHACCCGRRERRLHARFSALGGGEGGSTTSGGFGGQRTKGVTTADSEEAQRRRERGARALAERLAEKQRKAAAAAAAVVPPAPAGGGDDAV